MTKSPKISLIIPVFNQTSALMDTLTCLSQQSFPPKDLEVIVVNDGSTDDPQDTISRLELPFPYSIIRTENKGPAAARNRGAFAARGEILFFLDADMLAEKELIACHINAHQRHPQALIEGLRKPWKSAQQPLFMRIIDVDTNPARLPIDFSQILTCNLSMRKEVFLEVGGFDEELIRWQDVEFGYRANQKGIELVFLPGAVAYHNHPISFKQFCKKQLEHHRLAWIFFQKHPELLQHFSYLHDKRPINLTEDSSSLVIHKLARQTLASPPFLKTMEYLVEQLERHWSSESILHFLYWKIIGSYQLIGFRDVF